MALVPKVWFKCLPACSIDYQLVSRQSQTLTSPNSRLCLHSGGQVRIIGFTLYQHRKRKVPQNLLHDQSTAVTSIRVTRSCLHSGGPVKWCGFTLDQPERKKRSGGFSGGFDLATLRPAFQCIQKCRTTGSGAWCTWLTPLDTDNGLWLKPSIAKNNKPTNPVALWLGRSRRYFQRQIAVIQLTLLSTPIRMELHVSLPPRMLTENCPEPTWIHAL